MSTSSGAVAVVSSSPFPSPREQAAGTPAFALWAAQGSLVCDGIRALLPPVDADGLAQGVAEFFARSAEGPGILAGALPFDRRRPAHLFQPRGVRGLSAQWAATPLEDPQYRWRLVGGRDPSAYADAVGRAVRAIASSAADSPLRKVVLARTLELAADRPVDAGRVARRLARDPSVAAFLVRLPSDSSWPGAEPCLVGATPELLVAKSGLTVRSRPLAGSARRGRTAAEDRRLAHALLGSDKDRREHRAVVEAVLDGLAPYCVRLSAEGPALTSTESMWHLGTQIEGTLKDPAIPSVELVAALHPTPAVCGFPREQARATIEALEPFDRGFYAGAVGWTNRAGDGEWHVSIRCAEIADSAVRLFAGAGIVEGSDPVTETRETAAKFAALLDALGIDDAELAGMMDAR